MGFDRSSGGGSAMSIEAVVDAAAAKKAIDVAAAKEVAVK
jgi:hypothetical protein